MTLDNAVRLFVPKLYSKLFFDFIFRRNYYIHVY